jgi:3-oxoadipate enol-lactonase
MWAPQIAALGERFDVITYDMRGHGPEAYAPSGPYSLADLAGDVLALLDARGVERVHFCGLSIGGMIGQWLGANAPERIDRLVLCCTSSYVPPAEAWHERAATVRAAGSTEPIAETVVGNWLTPAYADEHPKEHERLLAMILACDPEGYAGCCEAIAGIDLRADLAKISAPTLVIGARDDPALPIDPHTDTLSAGISRARRAIVPGAHIASVESAGAVNELLLNHLEAA